MIPKSVEVFSTCVQNTDVEPDEFLQAAIDVSRWSDEVGCKGMLIYTDNRLVDAWLVAQIALHNTEHLCPLVAVQPVYMQPYTVANMVASLGLMYGRRIYLNMVAGGFRNDLLAMNDQTPHDKRYTRLVEYTHIIRELLQRSSEAKPLSFEGEFYTVDKLTLTPALEPELMPGIFVSGSSEAGLGAARTMQATAVQYPTRPEDFGNVSLDHGLEYGIRIGIIAREDGEKAWTIAEERFPVDRKGKLTRQLAARVSDSHWHKKLTEQMAQSSGGRDPYWLVPFENYRTMCPYLVGTHDDVASLVRTYYDKGYTKFILDIPPNLEELNEIATVFERCLPHGS